MPQARLLPLCALCACGLAGCAADEMPHEDHVTPAASTLVTGSLSVLANVDIFSAGSASGPQLIAVPPGSNQYVTFDVQGSNLSCCGTASPHDADGGTNLSTSILPSPPTGISGIKHHHKNIFLVGVFMSANGPDPASPPPTLYYSSSNVPDTISDTAESAAPLLNQTFFIGDGLTGTGTGSEQTFLVPSGATRLYLGFADGQNVGDFTHGLGNASPAKPGNYTDNTGSVAVTYTIDTSGPSQCGFSYDRLAAARMAYFLATQQSPSKTATEPSLANGIKLGRSVMPTPYSAYFMSLALLAGHLPTIRTPTDQGWFPSWDALSRLSGNEVWRNHSTTNATSPVLPLNYRTARTDALQFVPPSDVGGDRLVGYVSGATTTSLPPSGARAFAIDFMGRLLHCPPSAPASCQTGDVLVPLRQVFSDADQLTSKDHLDNVAPFLQRFDRGDYVYIDSIGDTHGFMIVGTGPVIDCKNEALNGVQVTPATMSLSYGGPANLNFNKPYQVPYVVDWNGKGTLYQRPRPFYCSYWPVLPPTPPSQLPERIFNHNYWLFVRTPNSGTYDCSQAHDPHVFVDDTTGAVRCDGGPFVIIGVDVPATCQQRCGVACNNAKTWNPFTPYLGPNQVSCMCE